MPVTRSRSSSAFALALALAFACAVASPLTLEAQAPSRLQQVLVSWQEFSAPTGQEEGATAPLAQSLAGWERDAVGNVMARRGRGTPRRVIACALDRPGFAVTQVTDDGYLRLHRVGGGGYPLFDQAHEGQQVNILTANGAVPGVIAIANGHFAAQHRADSLVVTADDLWLDVGAASAADVAALGISLLDRVERRVPAWPFAGGVAGAGVGARAGCAVLAAAAQGTVTRGETIFLMSTQGVFGWPGLGAALARLGPVDELTLVGPGRADGASRWARAGQTPGVNAAVVRISGRDSVRLINPHVRHAGSLVETLSEQDANDLLGHVTVAAGVARTSLPADPWIAAPVPRLADVARTPDALSATAGLLKRLADLPGIADDEWRVRDAVRAAMPAWAQASAETDDAGNLIVAMGPQRDTVVFIAHLDEVGWDIASIAADGLVTLRTRGGAIASAWEGQPALLHLPQGARGGASSLLPGIFVPRERARLKRPDAMVAWFGMDSVALVARGVRIGSGVTAHKDAVRLGATQFTGRAMDDRAGSVALLQALATIDPAKLQRRVLFVWSTAEEVGLVGAAALAARLGPSVRRVHSIDTFVSSDTPLESPHFAFAPLGRGPVLRGIENSSLVPADARALVTQVARDARIPLQLGLTQGGTDGTAFTFYGAPNVPLSWPGRYSHTPGEVLDLRDLEHLGALVAALAQSPR
jgi:putative aminopeptidase FrvX